MGDSLVTGEVELIRELSSRGLPPITSRNSLCAMLGINPGLIWSFQNRPARHYRQFSITSGIKVRRITAPKKGLKLIQQWLSYNYQKSVQTAEHVFGFVPNRCHIDAAAVHTNALWIYSIDIRDFFPTTTKTLVNQSLRRLGYQEIGAEIISSLVCLENALPQGAPTSPVLSNLCFQDVDSKLIKISQTYATRLSRYADDIVFSGVKEPPAEFFDAVNNVLHDTPWRVAENKTEFASLPKRLKVHGLLVHGDVVRLTKGYRNRIRALRHLQSVNKLDPDNLSTALGHLNYANQIDTRSKL